MLLAVVQPKVVQETLSHSDSDIKLTLNNYSHAVPTIQRGAAATMDEIHRGLAKSLDGDARTTPIYIKSIVIHRGLEPRTH